MIGFEMRVYAAGTRGSVCRTGCVSASRARRTVTVVYATTSATGRRTSALTVGTARRVGQSATAACATRTVTDSRTRRPLRRSAPANVSSVSSDVQVCWSFDLLTT